LSDEIYKEMTIQAESIGKQLNRYMAYLKRSKQGEKEIPTGYTIREGSELSLLDNSDEYTTTNH